MKAKVVVRAIKNEYQFVIGLHYSENQPYQIEPEFYFKNSVDHQVPPLPHFECELVEPALWNHSAREYLHIHQSAKTGRWYVCWPNHVANLTEARRIIEFWCCGTVYSMVNHKGWAGLFTANELQPNNFSGALLKLKKEFGVHVESFQTRH